MLGLPAYLAELGEADSNGQITLDPERTQRYLGQLQLPGPHHYLLKLVQAGVASGAPEITVEVRWMAITVAFVPRTPLELEGLLQHLFREGRPEMRCLAVGVNAALAVVKRVSLEQGGRRVVFSPEGRWEEDAPAGEGVRIRVSRTRWDTSVELALLRERCAWCPSALVVNGVPLRIAEWGGRSTEAQSYLVGSGLSAPATSRAAFPPRVERRFAGSRVPCEMVLSKERDWVSPNVAFVQYGVLLCVRTVKLGLKGVRAVVAVDGLATDLSGFEVLESAGLAERIERLRLEVRGMAERVRERE